MTGCSTTLVLLEGGPEAPAPVWRPGDRWAYRTREGFRKIDEWDESRVVQRVGPEGTAIAITRSGPTVHSERIETWRAPGVLLVGALYDDELRRFEFPLPRYAFPLVPGHSANLWIGNDDTHTGKQGPINHFVRIGGWRPIDTPAGRFDCIAIDILMILDDGDVWRYPTQCHDLFWYAPAAGQIVREERRAHYQWRTRDQDDGFTTMHRTTELVGFSRAPA